MFAYLLLFLIVGFANSAIIPHPVAQQLGADIDGEAADDYSGQSVSLSADGSVVAIGATANDGMSTHMSTGCGKAWQRCCLH